jgi:hypothetical protein
MKEMEIKERIMKSIDSEIEMLEKDLKNLKESKEKYKKELPSSDTVFAHGQTYDFDDENFLMVKVGMSFSNKYGERGKIFKINEDRMSVLALNIDTNKEENFSIERFNSCGWFNFEDEENLF